MTTVLKTKSMEIVQEESQKPGQNPFAHDLSNMGQHFGPNVTVMMPNHAKDECPYLKIVNRRSGEILRIRFLDAEEKK